MTNAPWLKMDQHLRGKQIAARALRIRTSTDNFLDANVETALQLERLGMIGLADLISDCIAKVRAELDAIDAAAAELVDKAA
jgi:hypothetical protein